MSYRPRQVDPRHYPINDTTSSTNDIIETGLSLVLSLDQLEGLLTTLRGDSLRFHNLLNNYWLGNRSLEAEVIEAEMIVAGGCIDSRLKHMEVRLLTARCPGGEYELACKVIDAHTEDLMSNPSPLWGNWPNAEYAEHLIEAVTTCIANIRAARHEALVTATSLITNR